MDHGFRTRARLQHVFDDGAGGHAIAFVVAQLTAAGALRIQQDVIGIGIGPLRPQLHAVGGAGAVGVGIPERVAGIVKRGRAGLELRHLDERIVSADGHLIGVGLVVLASDVVEGQRARLRVQARALAGGTVQGAAFKKIGAGLWSDADDRAPHVIPIRGDVGTVFQDVIRVEVVDLAGAVMAGGADIGPAVRAIVAPARLIQAHRCQCSGGLGDHDVLADVVDGGGV